MSTTPKPDPRDAAISLNLFQRFTELLVKHPWWTWLVVLLISGIVLKIRRIERPERESTTRNRT